MLGISLFVFTLKRLSSQTVQPIELEKRDRHPTLVLLPGF